MVKQEFVSFHELFVKAFVQVWRAPGSYCYLLIVIWLVMNNPPVPTSPLFWVPYVVIMMLLPTFFAMLALLLNDNLERIKSDARTRKND